MEINSFMQYAVILLLAAVIAVPLAKRSRLGAVLGYLAAGALIGPSGLQLIGNAGEISDISELGIVLMLFVIGLELSPQRLWVMRRQVFGWGSVQMLATTLLIGGACELLGLSWKPALVIGLGLALSSTAIGLQLLAERKELGSPQGRLAFSILLLQDVAAIPILALIPALVVHRASAATTPDTLVILRVILTLLAVVIGGRYLLRPLFRIAARTQIQEVFTASTLLVVLGTAWLMQLAGMSMSLGAFLAGVLLADSEYRHEIEARVDPFKGLLLGLFFMSVGMSANVGLLVSKPFVVLGILFSLLLIKGGVLFLIGRIGANLANSAALGLAAVLSQGGEFGFVVFTLAAQNHVIDTTLRDTLIVAVTLSMALTPLLVALCSRMMPPQRNTPKREFDAIDEQQPRVIIAGFGRVGQIVARVLHAQGVSFLAIENSVEQVEFSRRYGSKIYFGDPSNTALLRSAHVEKAEIFIVATDDPETNIRTARIIRSLYPHLRVFARARNRQHAFRLMDLGASVIRETFHSSLVLARDVLEGLGISAETASRHVETFRQHDEKLLASQHLIYDDEAALQQSTREAQKDLDSLFEADAKHEKEKISP